jgi:hypothetical protein
MMLGVLIDLGLLHLLLYLLDFFRKTHTVLPLSASSDAQPDIVNFCSGLKCKRISVQTLKWNAT